jgi:hypothetical protein
MRAKGGKKFADLLWPDRVLIEMKSRSEKLEKHCDQTFEYWTHIVPHRPPFVILCNFDEFCSKRFLQHAWKNGSARNRDNRGRIPSG